MSKKVSVIGAGAVGATLAQRVVESGLADVILVDIAKNIACGKSLDLFDAAPIIGHEKNLTGTDNYEHIQDSDIVVVTAGLPRKPGMTREELLAKNANIIRDVSSGIKIHSPSAIVIIVTNPLDAMTYLAYKTTGFKKEKVFGMAGVLDGSRLSALLARELNVPRSSVKTLVLGSHGDTMVPVISHTYIADKPVRGLLSEDKLQAIINRTRDRGAEILNLLGSGSAYYSPSAAVYKMISAILNDTKETMVVSAYLSGEYGLRDICIGVPCELGSGGIRKVIEIELTDEERAAFLKSSEAIKSSIDIL